jgi:predicted anti-sigma-YlaC factor YlaD
MTCDDVRARLIDALAMPRQTIDADIRAHLDSCPACRAARDDYSTMWRQLGELPVPFAPPDARARFERLPVEVRRRWAVGAERRTAWYVGALAATVLIAALAGYGAGTHRSSDQARIARAVPAASESTFLILLHEDSSFRHGETPAASAAMLAEYVRWARTLPSGVTFVGTDKLEDSIVWFGAPHEPCPQGDHLAGFLMIRAKDRAAAMQVSATSPHLKYGGRIELRMIER